MCKSPKKFFFPQGIAYLAKGDYNKCITALPRQKLEDSLMATAAITKDTIIGEILDIDETTAPYFLEMGMHCLGCPSARGETLEQACAVHGVDPDELVKKINEHLNK